jgi:hypothetical protein
MERIEFNHDTNPTIPLFFNPRWWRWDYFKPKAQLGVATGAVILC